MSNRDNFAALDASLALRLPPFPSSGALGNVAMSLPLNSCQSAGPAHREQTFASSLPRPGVHKTTASGITVAMIAAASLWNAPSTNAQTTLIRVAQAHVTGNVSGDAAFDANVVGVIKPWATTGTARSFYAYGTPIPFSFNGPMPLTNNRLHLFFAQTSDGLTAGGVFDRPNGTGGGSASLRRWIRPRSAELQDISGVDREGNYCSYFYFPGNDNWILHWQRQEWSAAETDGWMDVINDTTWTAFQVAFAESTEQYCDGYGEYCSDRSTLYSGLDSVAAMSADGSITPLRLDQDRVQFRPVAPCELVSWPTQQAQCIGGTASFGARPNSAGPATFAWYKNGTPVSTSSRVTITTSDDGLESHLSISGLIADDVGSYTCAVTSACVNSASRPLSLVLTSGTPTTSNPVGATIACGEATTLGVLASGNGPFKYQWFKGTALVHDVTNHITGSDTATLTIADAQPEQAGSYSCDVSNACGTVRSGSATVTVMGVRPTIGRQPIATTACAGNSAAFSLTFSGTGTVTYQWQQAAGNSWQNLANGRHGLRGTIAGATSATLVLNGISGDQATSYRCVLTNACGCAYSAAVPLTVCVGDVDNGSGNGVCDGGVTIDDLLYYLSEFSAGTTRADVDDGSGHGTPDGGVTIDDLLYYLFRFEAGC